MNISELFINNVLMPTPSKDGVSITRKPSMAWKTSLVVRWPLLSTSQAASILTALNSTSLTVQFADGAGSRRSYIMRLKSSSFTQYFWPTWTAVVGATVCLIES